MRRLLLTLGLCLATAIPAYADPARTVAPVAMRAAPAATARVVQRIPANAQIDLSDCGAAWCYASWRDRFGYVPARAVAAAPYARAPAYYGYGPGYAYAPPVAPVPYWGWGRPFYYGYGWPYRW